MRILSQKQDVKYTLSVLDAHGDELFGVVYATIDDVIIGKLDFSYWKYADKNPVSVKMIEVVPEYRRQGIATGMVNSLKEEFPDEGIDYGMTTPEGTGFVTSLAKAIKLLSYKIKPEHLRTLWYEDKDGNVIEDFDLETATDHPDGAYAQVSRFPTSLRENYIMLDDSRELLDSGGLFAGESTWPEDLVLAIVESGDYSLSEAILIGANACGRCLNALAHDYGLDWGYAEGSEEWKNTNTKCEFCEEEER